MEGGTFVHFPAACMGCLGCVGCSCRLGMVTSACLACFSLPLAHGASSTASLRRHFVVLLLSAVHVEPKACSRRRLPPNSELRGRTCCGHGPVHGRCCVISFASHRWCSLLVPPTTASSHVAHKATAPRVRCDGRHTMGQPTIHDLAVTIFVNNSNTPQSRPP